MKPLWLSILIMLIISGIVSTSEANWLIFHESELKGQILDIDTKQPIEGAVVVVVYTTGNPGIGTGQGSSNIGVGETLTDKEGKFLIPSYTTIIQPFSWKRPSSMIIFKPGYVSLDWSGYLRPKFFTGEETKDHEGTLSWSKESVYKYKIHRTGIVELPMLKSREERMKIHVSPVEDSDHNSVWYFKKQKLFIKAIREEWRNLYGKDPSNLYRWEDK